MKYRVILSTLSGELDRFEVDALQTSVSAALVEQLLDEWTMLTGGDRITVQDIEEPQA